MVRGVAAARGGLEASPPAPQASLQDAVQALAPDRFRPCLSQASRLPLPGAWKGPDDRGGMVVSLCCGAPDSDAHELSPAGCTGPTSRNSAICVRVGRALDSRGRGDISCSL